jgi:hypothetical protein
MEVARHDSIFRNCMEMNIDAIYLTTDVKEDSI